VARLKHFAKGHACIASHADTAILFRKKLKKREDVAPPQVS
jgi:hypothetical protein